MKRSTIRKILRKRTTYGYFWKCSNGRYNLQNDNDLGLMLDEWADEPVVIQRKIKCGFGYIYQIRNRPGCIDPDEYETASTLKGTIAFLRYCHVFKTGGKEAPLTNRERRLLKNYI